MNVRMPLAVVVTATALIAMASPHLARAQQVPGFGASPVHDLVPPPFTDRDIGWLVATLDTLLSASKPPAQWTDDARATLGTFTARLQAGRLSAPQEATVIAHLSGLAHAHPDEQGPFDTARRVVTSLTIGKTAPDIVGKDLKGDELRLSDYRGKVVVVMFSGEWCGICRSQYPYERLLLELYKDWPFAILGINSDADSAAAGQAYAAQGLTFRSWSDAPPNRLSRGPIATAWGVTGWPTSYVIDAAGVIRFVNLRQEDLLKGVRQVLTEQQIETAAQRRR